MADEKQLIDILTEQEQRLVFDRFDEETAWTLGSRLVADGQKAKAPIIINIRTADRILFHAALPGSSPDNDHWARRKSNVTLRMHKASMRVGESLRLRGRELGPDVGIDPIDYASHGGSFPIRVKGVGVVAAVTVSGLAQQDDHDMIVVVLEAMLKP